MENLKQPVEMYDNQQGLVSPDTQYIEMTQEVPEQKQSRDDAKTYLRGEDRVSICSLDRRGPNTVLYMGIGTFVWDY